jgi:serine/threonine protein kinase
VTSPNDLLLRLAAALKPQYELRELLGRGGFGEVYAAFDTELRREVAVKILRPELSQVDAVVQRFRREAERRRGSRWRWRWGGRASSV